jgi:four helix bundle protein
MHRFDHERLDVYKVSIELVAELNRVIEGIPSGRSDIIHQAQKAALSIPLNIAEGSGEFSKPEKKRFYRMARRSATECAAALDVLQALDMVTAAQVEKVRGLLERVVAMLTKMILQGTKLASARASASARVNK